jgi:acetyl-CoA acetyltransferase
MESAVIVDAVRSPVGRGKAGGALSDVNPVDLLAQVLKWLFDRNDVDPGEVEDVITGCVPKPRSRRVPQADSLGLQRVCLSTFPG